MHRFVFVIALLTSSASAATWGSKAFAFHRRVAAGQGVFSLAHLMCMQGTFDCLLMDTPPGQPTEPLVPHYSEVMEIDLCRWRSRRGPESVGTRAAGGAAGGAAGSRADPESQYYAMVCSHCPGRHWFSTVYTNPQVQCPQCCSYA